MDNNMDLISVVIPTYKRNDTLIRALDSIVNQTYKNIEIIVVDDNADYPEIREKNNRIIQKYDNIIIIENEKNLGGGLSRNEGIKKASGKYIAFLDDDDEYLPSKIYEQYSVLKNSNGNVAMVYCYANMIYVDGSVHKFVKDLEGNLLIENIADCIAATSWWMCPRDILLDVGGFEDISSRQDASLLLKFFLKGYEVKRVPKVLLNYYWHDSQSGISKINSKMIEAEKQYKKLYVKNIKRVDIKKRKQGIYYFDYRLAMYYILLGERKQAFSYYRRMISAEFFKLKNIKILLGIVFNNLYRFFSRIKNKRKIGK